MKTIRAWLEELPEEYREKALNNYKESKFPEPVPSMSKAIWGAFVWNDTPEGHIFWEDLVCQLEKLNA